MKNKKNNLSIFLTSLAISPILATMTTIACKNYENFEFFQNPNGNYTIRRYIGKDNNVTIPSKYKGRGVEKIGSGAFKGTKITSITIPSSVEEIGYQAFSNCSELIKIKVDSDNTTYDSRNNCNAIIETKTNTLISGCKNTNIPQGIEKIGLWAFEGTKITSITIPNSVKEIGWEAFKNCYNLRQITLNEGLKKIAYRAFENTIEDLKFGEGTTKITTDITGHFKNIKKVTIPSSVEEIGSHAFSNRSNLTQVTLNEGLEKIGSGAFKGTKITSITIPSSVEEIGYQAFSNCSELIKIKVDSDNTTYDSRNNCNAIIETKTNTLISGCKNTNIPWTIKRINESAFLGTGISSITIPSSVEEIGWEAFENCYNLTQVTLNEGLKKISHAAFEGTKIKSITIPSSVEKIEWNSFSYCSELTKIKVDSDNTTYDSRNNCNAIIETKTNTLISGCKNTNIPQGIEKIGYQAFAGTKIKSIVIPSSIKEIDSRAFENCSKLKKVICKVLKNKITWKWSDLGINESIVEYV